MNVEKGDGEMAKPTPGPWTVIKHEHAYGELWLSIGYVAEDGSTWGPVCDIEGKTFIPAAEIKYQVWPEERQWANAHLIAAAPQLRDALQKARKVLGNLDKLYHPEYLLHTHALLEECDAALRAAGGEGG